MKRHLVLKSLLSLTILVLLGACGSKNQQQDGLNVNDELNANFYAADSRPQPKDPVRSQLASFFLVEHFAIQVNPTMKQALATDQPGGILFWNSNKADSQQVRALIREYSLVSKGAGHMTPLFSADYEGGALELVPSGKMVAGVQRFTVGFTKLAQPIWLGLSMQKFGDELCRLHGEIIAREMQSIGLNYPLSVSSDLAMRLFADRGISKDPMTVVNCMHGIMDSIAKQKDIVFVTKHFPGLGQTVGDSHEVTATSIYKTPQEAYPHLEPFEKTISSVNANGSFERFSILASHGLYPAYDPSSISTESPKILQGLLRDQLGFKGLLVSDAMWMGKYGQMSGDRLMAAYLKAFVSGMDLLMIPGAKFAQSLTFFRAAYDQTLTAQQKSLVEAEFGLPFAQVHQQFLARTTQSLARLNSVRSTLPAAADMMDAAAVTPSDETLAARNRYDDILRALDTRFLAILPKKN